MGLPQLLRLTPTDEVQETFRTPRVALESLESQVSIVFKVRPRGAVVKS